MANSKFFLKRWLVAFRSSLSLKLIGIFVGGSILLIMFIGGVSRFALERHTLSTVQPLLNHYIEYLANEIENPPNIEKVKSLTNKWPLIIRIFSDKINFASDDKLQQPSTPTDRWRSPNKPTSLQVYWDHGIVFLRTAKDNTYVYYGINFRSTKVATFPIIFISIMLLALYGFYRLTKNLFSPLEKIKNGITKIGSGKLKHRINIKRTDELGQLAADVNQMAQQLDNMLQAKRDLLLAISHELKSPLTRSRVTLELLDDSSYRQALIKDQKEMQRLIDEIIEAERSQGVHALLHCQMTDVNVLIHDVIINLAATDKIQSKVLTENKLIMIDASQTKRLIRNLLENALRYNRDEVGKVQIKYTIKQNKMILTVSDNGLGIAPEHLEHLTEAFYRADPARDRKTGGLGLGLYLCQAIINSHQGQIDITSKIGIGTKVKCSIPLTS